MMRLYSLFFLCIFSASGWAQEQVFQGRVDFGQDLASFERKPATPGTLYLLSGSAAAIHVLSEDPFVAEVDFIQGEWQGESVLAAHRVTLRFEGQGWKPLVLSKKPSPSALKQMKVSVDQLIYPYRKFQVAALPAGSGFRVVSVPLLF